MEQIKSEKELQARFEKCGACLQKKFHCEPGHKAIVVCGGTGCLSADSQVIIDKFNELIKANGLEDKVTANIVGCFGFCSQGPFVKVFPEETLYVKVKVSDVEELFEKDIKNNEVVERLLFVDPQTKQHVQKQHEITFYKLQRRDIALHGNGEINPEDINEAIGNGAFQGLNRALHMTREEVIDEVLKSGLRGRGGAGFPTGRKWSFVPKGDGPKYMICNGDEGDPGAFMDRSIIEGNPCAVIEGMMIAGYAIGAQNGYFYVRAEYPIAVKRLAKAIKELEEIGILGDHILGTDFSFRCHIRLGAGAFVCGEETALINSIEGKRGMPRPRPPFPAVKGLWGHPSVVNNVETLACVPYILREGWEKFAAIGTDDTKGTKVFALGGKVNNVGLVEVPMGTTLRQLIYDIGGGIPGGKKFKAIQTGGPSGGCLTEKDLDTPIDFGSLVAAGSMMGSGGAIVMDEDNCMVDVAKFYLEDLKELSNVIRNNSLCALGQTATNPILSTLKAFPEEYEAHVKDHKCPAHVCKNMMEYYILPNKCIGCGLCMRNCPVGAIAPGTEPAHLPNGNVNPGKFAHVIDPKKCVKCGSCLSGCRIGAITKR